jgi:hypothetical protein
MNADQVRAWESAVAMCELNNPYSLSCFPPVADADWERLSNLVLSEFGHSIDRYSAAAMSMAWQGCASMIREMAITSSEAE